MEVSEVWQNKAFLDNGQVRLEYLIKIMYYKVFKYKYLFLRTLFFNSLHIKFTDLSFQTVDCSIRVVILGGNRSNTISVFYWSHLLLFHSPQ